MSSAYDHILEKNSARIPRPWRSFAKRDASAYGAEVTAWKALAYGYKNAADMLAKECYNAGHREDILASPIFFLFRHYVELEMKATWKELFLRDWLDREPPQNEHRISILWRTIRDVCTSRGILCDDEDFVVCVDKSLYLINQIDSRSTHSRYPSVRGKYHEIGIDLEGLICAIDDIDTLLFGLSIMIDEADP